VKLRLMSLRYW